MLKISNFSSVKDTDLYHFRQQKGNKNFIIEKFNIEKIYSENLNDFEKYVFLPLFFSFSFFVGNTFVILFILLFCVKKPLMLVRGKKKNNRKVQNSKVLHLVYINQRK